MRRVCCFGRDKDRFLPVSLSAQDCVLVFKRFVRAEEGFDFFKPMRLDIDYVLYSLEPRVEAMAQTVDFGGTAPPMLKKVVEQTKWGLAVPTETVCPQELASM